MGHAQCLQAGPLDTTRVYKSTGVPALDDKFNTEANLLYGAFGVIPNLLVVDDGGSPNAYASEAVTLSGFTGTVYFGLTLIRDELWAASRGEIALAGVMAHEFAHIAQYQRDSPLTGKSRELHADFLAGYYLARRQYLVPAHAQGFFVSLYAKGDRDFWSPDHHGTPEERVLSALAGYQRPHLDFYQAYVLGEAVVLDE